MDLDAIAVFVKVVQAGSFSRAARLLGMPNTTVSAKVARLEKDLGVTLIRRTTRRLYVTPAGQAFFARSVRGLAEIETARAEISSARIEPCGLLRISVAGDVAHSLLPPLITRFVREYPEVRVDMIVTNRAVDLVGEGVDLAIRAGELKDSTLVVRKFLPITGGLWASAAYLTQRGRPRTPSDLEKHDCLVFARFDLRSLTLTDAGHSVEVSLKGRIVVDDLETLRELAALGNGIAPLPDFLAGKGDGAKLERVLPRWTWTRGALSFVYPSQPFVPANVRAFIDLALAAQKGEKRAWAPAPHADR
jgi:DNA-binding transcriptional LysR family regulator